MLLPPYRGRIYGAVSNPPRDKCDKAQYANLVSSVLERTILDARQAPPSSAPPTRSHLPSY